MGGLLSLSVWLLSLTLSLFLRISGLPITQPLSLPLRPPDPG